MQAISNMKEADASLQAKLWVKLARVSTQEEKQSAAYNKAIEITPNMEFLLLLRVSLLDEIGEKEKALADYNHLINIKPNDASTLTSRGFLLLKMGENEKALADVNKALEIEPH